LDEKARADFENKIRGELEVKIRGELEVKIRAELERKIREEVEGKLRGEKEEFEKLKKNEQEKLKKEKNEIELLRTEIETRGKLSKNGEQHTEIGEMIINLHKKKSTTSTTNFRLKIIIRRKFSHFIVGRIAQFRTPRKI